MVGKQLDHSLRELHQHWMLLGRKVQHQRRLSHRDEAHRCTQTLRYKRDVASTNPLQKALRNGACVQNQGARRRVKRPEELQNAVHDFRTQSLERARVEQVMHQHLHKLQHRVSDAEGLGAD